MAGLWGKPRNAGIFLVSTMNKLWRNCHVATMAGGKYSIIRDAAIVTSGSFIEWVGPLQQVPSEIFSEEIDLNSAWVTPGLVDCHTHTVFGGNRSAEFEQRLEGVSYEEIAARGGGILSTVRATRVATEEQLFEAVAPRVESLLRDGVTTLEIKSGYGLDWSTERRMLRVAQRVQETYPVTIKKTCLAAHTIPPEFEGRADEYVDYICQMILPSLANEKLVDAVDGFCECIGFSPDQIERIFKAARLLKLPVKLHAEQLSPLNGSSLAARYNALSADHLEYVTEDDAKAMAASGTVAVVLPGAYYFLRETKRPPIDLFRSHGVPMAISTDMNPGTSPALSLRLMMNMACTLFRMTPEECLAGVTINAATALGLGKSHGSIEAGKYADFVAWKISEPAELSYWIGGDLSKRVFRHGAEVKHG